LLEVFIPDQKSGDVRAYAISSVSSTAKLDTVYIRVLEHSMKRVNDRDKPKLAREFRDVIRLIILLSEPLSPTALESLLNAPRGTVSQRLRHL
jgi:hypothetical protein